MKQSAAYWEKRRGVWGLSALFGENCAACLLPDVG